MYISTDKYEEMYLKGRSESELEAEVEKLRREIERLKMKVESPAYSFDPHQLPSDAATISIYRMYFDVAVDNLSKLKGNQNVLNEKELRAKSIDANVDFISCLSLTIGKNLDDKFILNIDREKAVLTEEKNNKPVVSIEKDKSKTLNFLKDLHIGQWRERYSAELYGYVLDEPIKWQLKIEYQNGFCDVFFEGFGVFPYNFDSLCRFLGAELF